MSSCYLSEIRINNFKVISEEVPVRFDDHRLVVLDGPNGFGKTTIFDAIEILITGRVNRIHKTEYRPTDKPVVYANDPAKAIVIKGKFRMADSSDYVIMRRIDNPSTGGTIDDLEERFTLHELESLDNKEGNQIIQADLNAKLKLFPSEKVYNLMHYIPQEETLEFLKKNENARLKQINELFNIGEISDKYEKYKAFRSTVKKRLDRIKGTKAKKGQIDEIEEELVFLKNIVVTGQKDYNQLISWKSFAWDVETLAITDKNYKRINDELRSVKYFVENHSSFKHDKLNIFIEKYTNEQGLRALTTALELVEHIDSYEEIKHANVQHNGYVKTLEQIEKKNFSDLLVNKQFNETTGSLYNKETEKGIKQLIQDCIDFEKEIKTSESIITEIEKVRQGLKSKFESFIESNAEEKNLCPYCGFNYDELSSSLDESFVLRTEHFNKKAGKVEKLLLDNLKVFDVEFSFGISSSIEAEVKQLGHNQELFEKLKKNEANFAKIKTAILTIKNIIINSGDKYDDIVIKEKDLLEKVEILRRYLISKKVKLDDEFAESKDEFDLETIFTNVFDSTEVNVLKLKPDDIAKKIKFVEARFFSSQVIQREILNRRLVEYKDKLEALEFAHNEMKKIENVYKTEINSYTNDMIRLLEIPFYLYSGKVLHDYHEGLGVFIKSEANEELNKIKFVSSNNSKHDLLNKFSSGQLAGVVIAFVLSMNTLFAKDSLGLILIDDPVQTMDEINMFSLVELMRSEFKNRQIVLSTHEDSVSRYFRYKFLKYGIEPLSFDVRNKLHKKVFEQVV